MNIAGTGAVSAALKKNVARATQSAEKGEVH